MDCGIVTGMLSTFATISRHGDVPQWPRRSGNCAAIPPEFKTNRVRCYEDIREPDLTLRVSVVVARPHSESTFPWSREVLDRILHGVPEHERAKVVGLKKARLYNFDLDVIRAGAEATLTNAGSITNEGVA